MPRESETKFKIEGFSGIRRRLRKAGAIYLRTVLQTDVFFDTPDAKLRNNGCGLRLRRQRRLAGKADPNRDLALMTFKGPPQPNPGIKIRQEFEARVEDPDSLTEILRRCGLRITAKIQKRRATYRLGRCLVELDELPLLGRFVEIEGPSEKAIRALAERLSLTGEMLSGSYLQLLSDSCGDMRHSFKEVLFEK